MRSLGDQASIAVIVDVLSFSTCVSIAIDRDPEIFPFWFKDESAVLFAEGIGARLAGPRSKEDGLSLSPMSMRSLGEGDKVVLPSPNGATLSLETQAERVVAGCLRNHTAVSAFARGSSNVIVLAAGERWPNGNLRFAVEDFLGAGAILSGLKGRFSPEAELAAEAFNQSRGNLAERIRASVSGRELIEWGFPSDVDLACEESVSEAIPILRDGRYQRFETAPK